MWIYKLKWERICTGVSEVASGCIYPKYENLIECQERQHIDVIPGTGDFNFAEKWKYLEIESAWFPMVAKGTNSGHLQQVLNTEVSCGPSTSELKKVRINTLEDVLSSDLRSFISSDVAEDMILFTKQLFEQIRKYFINDNQYRFHTNIHRIQLL